MSVAFGGIEEKIADTGTGDMLMLGSYIGEDDPGRSCFPSPRDSSLFEVLFTEIGEAK